MRCNQCSAAIINGVFCHEIGCPNMRSRYDAALDAWIKMRECSECGSIVDQSEPCCNEENE